MRKHDGTMNQYGHFAINDVEVLAPQAAATSGQWRLLRRLQIPERFNDPTGAQIKSAVVVDVETTGLSTENDDVIQLAILPFDYEPESGRILTVHKNAAFSGLREPSVPISEEASLITGITDEMVSGNGVADARRCLFKSSGPATAGLLNRVIFPPRLLHHRRGIMSIGMTPGAFTHLTHRPTPTGVSAQLVRQKFPSSCVST
jgi:DNA polymerase III subunit epsilon